MRTSRFWDGLKSRTMCKTTTPPRPAAQDAIRKLPANTTAAAVIALQSYLQKYVNQFSNLLVPATRPSLPPDVDPNAYKRVAISVWPLRNKAVSPYYAGVFDDDTDFSASLVKAAALFAAGQLLADAKNEVSGATSAASFLASLSAGLQAEINANADQRVVHAHFPSGSPVGLLPQTSSVLKVTGAGTSTASVTFTDTFNANLSLMIVQSDDPASAVCIDRLGYGYISAALIEENFFDPAKGTGNGIWLAGDYANSNTYIRIPCVNDHPDAQLTTTRQMCRLFAMIRLKQLPEHDLDTNDLMQNLLKEPKPGGTVPWLSPTRVSVFPQFSFVLDKIGFAGLGAAQFPNVYSEGLVIKWNDTSQVDSFNNKIDPGATHPDIRLSGEIAICWQNLLADNLHSGFDGIVEVLNESISDFLDQKAL